MLIKTISELRRQLCGRGRVALVPTMGNLHAGHISLVRRAKEHADMVVTSIFVNRTQFAPHEDFHQYPRTIESDCDLLEKAGCDVTFAPEECEIYPDAQPIMMTPPRELSEGLEGAVRPWLFAGVCTVVFRLFALVQPSVAVFGKKDYQQLLVVREMVRQLGLPIKIIAGETVRGAGGLALSSRNSYLGTSELIEAARLNAVLRQTAEAARLGAGRFAELERIGCERLIARGWRPDYVAIRRQADLGEPSNGAPIVVLGAARLGKTRLIDNIEA